MSVFLLILVFITPLPDPSSASPLHENHFTKSIPPSLRQTASQEYLELTPPLPSDHLTPSCSRLLLLHDFGNTVGQPPVSATYNPPSHCHHPPWSHIVLEFSASCKGEQYDRIAGVWLAGVEILRTSTAEPTDDGVFWKVRKDVTRYSSLLVRSKLTVTVMLENVVNDVFTGVYHVNLTLLYYGGKKVGARLSQVADHQKQHKKFGFFNDDEAENHLGFKSDGFLRNPVVLNKGVHDVNNQKSSLNPYETPADLIIPVSGIPDGGFWFRIQSDSDVYSKGIQIPPNTWKAVLEVFVSFHGNDEFWYSNPPDIYLETNNLTTARGHGSYREVFVTIDGKFVGSVVPFPIIFTGGINPLFWEPVVATGAFNLPSYDFDFTPLLGLLLDEKTHQFGLGVVDSIPFWLVDANLHLWLDHRSPAVQASAVDRRPPAFTIKRRSMCNQLDGSFYIVAKRRSQFTGWVKTKSDNLTTHVIQQSKFINTINFLQNGTVKMVNQKVIAKTQVKVDSGNGILISRAMVKTKYPLKITISTQPGLKNDTAMIITEVDHTLQKKASDGNFTSSVSNSQDSSGWVVVKDHSVVSGRATTHQSYSKRDEFGCYSRVVAVVNGQLQQDKAGSACLSSF